MFPIVSSCSPLIAMQKCSQMVEVAFEKKNTNGWSITRNRSRIDASVRRHPALHPICTWASQSVGRPTLRDKD